MEFHKCENFMTFAAIPLVFFSIAVNIFVLICDDLFLLCQDMADGPSLGRPDIGGCNIDGGRIGMNREATSSGTLEVGSSQGITSNCSLKTSYIDERKGSDVTTENGKVTKVWMFLHPIE